MNRLLAPHCYILPMAALSMTMLEILAFQEQCRRDLDEICGIPESLLPKNHDKRGQVEPNMPDS